MAWFFWTAGTYLFSAQLLFGFVEVCGATFPVKAYNVFLLYVAFALFSLVINTVAFKIVPRLVKVFLVYIICTSIFLIVALLVRAHPKPSAREVFVDVVNETGWSSNGLVFFFSLLPGVTAINGFDSAAHMADELSHPATQVPQVMIGTVLLCGFSGLPMVIALLFSITKPENLLTPIAGQPVYQLMLDSFDSFALTVIGCLIYVIQYTNACGTITTTASRCWWAFARCGAFPFEAWQGRVHDKLQLPVNAIIVTGVTQVLIGLLIFGTRNGAERNDRRRSCMLLCLIQYADHLFLVREASGCTTIPVAEHGQAGPRRQRRLVGLVPGCVGFPLLSGLHAGGGLDDELHCRRHCCGDGAFWSQLGLFCAEDVSSTSSLVRRGTACRLDVRFGRSRNIPGVHSLAPSFKMSHINCQVSSVPTPSSVVQFPLPLSCLC